MNTRADEVLNLLALNRYAGAVVVGTVVTNEQLEPYLWIQQTAEGYQGNLIGGSIAGEDQHALVRQDGRAKGDRVIRLALSLMRSANSELDDDFKYFRYWSVLEILADHRVARKQPVTLLDGTSLLSPDGKPRTTSRAAPRVYQYLKSRFMAQNEQNFLAPAEDLWEAVEAWYGRRNATAHRGGFDPSEPNWPPDSPVLKTGGKDGLRDEWLVRLRDTTTAALLGELR